MVRLVLDTDDALLAVVDSRLFRWDGSWWRRDHDFYFGAVRGHFDEHALEGLQLDGEDSPIVLTNHRSEAYVFRRSAR